MSTPPSAKVIGSLLSCSIRIGRGQLLEFNSLDTSAARGRCVFRGPCAFQCSGADARRQRRPACSLPTIEWRRSVLRDFRLRHGLLIGAAIRSARRFNNFFHAAPCADCPALLVDYRDCHSTHEPPSDMGHCCSVLFFFIPYLQPNGNMQPLHGVGWTLNFEMFFYLTFAVALFLPRRISVPLLSAVLCGAVILGSLLSPSFAPLRYWTDPIILEFVFGMLIALVYRQQGTLLPMWARLCIITASAATVWFFAPRPPSGYRALEWGLPAAMIVAASVLGPRRCGAGLRRPSRKSWAMRPTRSI